MRDLAGVAGVLGASAYSDVDVVRRRADVIPRTGMLGLATTIIVGAEVLSNSASGTLEPIFDTTAA